MQNGWEGRGYSEGRWSVRLCHWDFELKLDRLLGIGEIDAEVWGRDSKTY